MRINDTNPSATNASAARGSQKVHVAHDQAVISAAPGGVAKSGDNVQFSNVASNVSAQSLSINQTDSVERAVKIDHLTELVESGQYNPDPVKIADSMIRDMLSGTGAF